MKILVVSCSGMGNTILATPMLRRLRKNFPSSRIDLLVRKSYFAAPVQHSGWFDTIHTLEDSPMHKLWELRNESYDFSIPCFPARRAAYPVVLRLIGAKVRLAHHYRAEYLNPLCAQWTVPVDPSLHDTAQNLQLLRFWDIPFDHNPSDPDLTYALPPHAQKWATTMVQDKPQVLGIHAFVGKTCERSLIPHRRLTDKQAPTDRFIAEIRGYVRQYPATKVLLFGSGPELLLNADLAEELRHANIHAEIVQGTLDQTAALIARCTYFISNATGLMHIAAAYRIPQLAFFHSDSPNRARPLHAQATIEVSGIPYTYPF